MTLLHIRNLRVAFGTFVAVDGLDLDVDRSEVVGIVGESGSGKSVAMLAIMGLVDAPGQVTADIMEFDGVDLLKLSANARRKLLGRDIAMVFQDAQSSLDPSYTVGDQIKETLRTHTPLRGTALTERAIALLEMVEIPDPARRLHAYPHQLSGGMSQRVMIALAIACQPELLIADEPTTALDVIVQAQVMKLLAKLQREQDMGLILITHDLALVAQAARRVGVMYAGQMVELQEVPALFDMPRHPYTRALLDAIPEHNRGATRLSALPGIVPGQFDRPAGCLLSPRCLHTTDRCHSERPALLGDGAKVRCFTPLDAQGNPTHG